MVGALFWELGDRHDYESILSRAAVLFYCVAFFIFMSVAVLPITVMERDIVDKEVLNGYYNPYCYQIAQGIATIPGAAVLAGLVSLIIITMLKFKDPAWYFLNMFLSLMTSEALAQMVSHAVPHFVIGIAMIAGLFGFFMLFQGFMLVPSDFPDWLRWTNSVAFHTYSWRSFMVTEFAEEIPRYALSDGRGRFEILRNRRHGSRTRYVRIALLLPDPPFIFSGHFADSILLLQRRHIGTRCNSQSDTRSKHSILDLRKDDNV